MSRQQRHCMGEGYPVTHSPPAFVWCACRCGPCQMIGPIFVKLSEDPAYANIVFLKVDVDANQVGCAC